MWVYVQGFSVIHIAVADSVFTVVSCSYMTNQNMNQRMMSNSESAAYCCLKEKVLHF